MITVNLTRQDLLDRIEALEAMERKMIKLNADLQAERAYLLAKIKRIKFEFKTLASGI